jgi:hypothetical protein
MRGVSAALVGEGRMTAGMLDVPEEGVASDGGPELYEIGCRAKRGRQLTSGKHGSKKTRGRSRRRSATPTSVAPIALSPFLLRRATTPLASIRTYERLEIDSHQGLEEHRLEIARRVNENPGVGVLLLVNPVMAFAEVNVKLSREVADHVLHTIRHPRLVRERRDALTQRLEKSLGEKPRPTDPVWTAKIVFERLHVEPRETDGHAPSYHPAIDEKTMARLAELRPTLAKRHRKLRRALRGTRLTPAPWRPTRRRLDLEASVPVLPRAAAVPSRLTLEALWFYKDAHPLAHELLELGLIASRGAQVHSADGYRRIRGGDQVSLFRALVTRVRLSDAARPRSRPR